MPRLIPSRKFLEDIEKFQSDAVMRKKIAKTLSLLEHSPFHPDLHVERIVNVPKAWSVRIDRRYRLSFEPEKFCLREIRMGLVQFCSYALWGTMLYTKNRDKRGLFSAVSAKIVFKQG